jgi:hypothetical protein
MGTVGVAAALHMSDNWPAVVRVLFMEAPTAGSKGPAQQEQVMILNRQVGFRGDDGLCRAGAGT